MSAPQLHTIGELLDNNSLPLLVQQRSGVRLLLHRSIRLPYVVCQSLASSSTDNNFFLIPLNNKGFYGAVSRHDEPTSSYANLSHILQEPTLSDSIDILIDNVTPVRCLDNSTNKFTSKVLLPGEVIHIVRNKRCPLLNDVRGSSLCCFGGGAREVEEDTVCVRDADRHIHMDKYMMGRFFVVTTNHLNKMQAGHVYSLQDITQHQGLPKVVCSVSAKQTSRDEIPLPSVFRVIKVISDRVTLAYSLLVSNHPMPENILEISSYCTELFAIAESCRVTMDDIKDHHCTMAIRRAVPGTTISHEDFEEITMKGSSFPPKLPGRPPTLRLKASNTDTSRLVSQVQRVSLMGDSDTLYRDGQTTPDRRSYVTSSNQKSFHTVNLPTKDRKSILKRFSSVSASAKSKEKPSMRSILDKLHGKAADDNNNDDNKIKERPKKSLRGLDIVHVLPNAQSQQEIDLSKSLFTSPRDTRNNSTNESTISSTTSSQERSSNHMDDFIHSHYDFLDKQHDSSSHYSAPYSDGSSHRDSALSSRSVVKFSGISSEMSRRQRTSSPSSNPPTENNGPARRSLRESLARSSAGVGDAHLSNGYDGSHDHSVVWTNRPSSHGPPQTNKVPIPDYVRPPSAYLSSDVMNKSHGSKPRSTRPSEKPSSERPPTATPAPASNHLAELRSKFTSSESGGLKSPIDRDTKSPREAKSPTVVIAKPVSVVDELKMRFEGQISVGTEQQTKKKNIATVTKPNDITHDDTYLLPVRSSGCIKLTG